MGRHFVLIERERNGYGDTVWSVATGTKHEDHDAAALEAGDFGSAGAAQMWAEQRFTLEEDWQPTVDSTGRAVAYRADIDADEDSDPDMANEAHIPLPVDARAMAER